ncbi:hypothetical protein KV699_14350 [Vreelandella titanicae]|nr:MULTISPECIES: hypothetical protein [Halomonas]MCD1586451.1 hypothetical protein [Halomonas sp. IOP_14]
MSATDFSLDRVRHLRRVHGAKFNEEIIDHAFELWLIVFDGQKEVGLLRA